MADERVSVARLRELIRLDEETGLLYWRMNRGKGRTGQRALANVAPLGYLRGNVDRVPVKAHRVVWAMTYGEWPKGVIDHIDGDTSNNHISNLRDTNQTENQRNTWLSKNNTSGVVGVNRFDDNHWRAFITVAGRQKHLGLFASFEAAVEARKAAEARFGFTKRHGTKKAA